MCNQGLALGGIVLTNDYIMCNGSEEVDVQLGTAMEEVESSDHEANPPPTITIKVATQSILLDHIW